MGGASITIGTEAGPETTYDPVLGSALMTDMRYRMMGNTGIQVSVLSYGFWATYGVKEDMKGGEGVERAKDMLRVVRQGGINCFDHAEAYGIPNGEAERIFGLALSDLQEEDPGLWRREVSW